MSAEEVERSLVGNGSLAGYFELPNGEKVHLAAVSLPFEPPVIAGGERILPGVPFMAQGTYWTPENRKKALELSQTPRGYAPR
jgi:hypothetical protein